MTTLRAWCLVAPLTLIACYSSDHRGVDGGAERDAGDVDATQDATLDGAVDIGVGPPCDHPLPIPCIVATGDGVLEAPSPSFEIKINGFIIAPDGAHTLYRRLTSDPTGTNEIVWETVTFDSHVQAGAITGLDVLSYDPGGGAALRLSTGELHFAWRVNINNLAGTSIATETHEAQMAVGGGVIPLPPADRDSIESSRSGLALAQTDDGTLVVGRVTSTGLAFRSATRESTIPFTATVDADLQMAALSGGRVVAMAQEQSSSSSVIRRTAVVLGRALDEQARSTVFEGPYSLDSLLVMGDDIYIARFERLFDRLDGSRLRIAHLDATLNRIEPDRALDGWGGLEPSYSTLVAWHGRPWIVWRTIDVRYGANPVIYALPLAEEACAASVDRPLVIFSDTSALDSMHVATDDASLWLITAPRFGLSLHAYRFAECP